MQVEKFYQIIASNKDEIEAIIKNIDTFYKERKEAKNDKFGKQKVDKFGNPIFRIIRPSKGRLKIIQSIIHKNILRKIEFPKYVKAVKGGGIFANALEHKGKKYKFQTDLKSFFDKISNKQVHQMLILRGFGKDVSSLITQLTTYKGSLPQGTSTSQILANLVFLSTDEKINAYCIENNLHYTRYVDDLTISSAFDFKKGTLDILDIIKNDDYKISHSKTSYKSVAIITGIKVSQNNIDVTDEYKEKMKSPKSVQQKQGLETFYNTVQYYDKVRK